MFNSTKKQQNMKSGIAPPRKALELTRTSTLSSSSSSSSPSASRSKVPYTLETKPLLYLPPKEFKSLPRLPPKEFKSLPKVPIPNAGPILPRNPLPPNAPKIPQTQNVTEKYKCQRCKSPYKYNCFCQQPASTFYLSAHHGRGEKK